MRANDVLLPPVPRLTDWLGVWSIEPTYAATLLATVRGTDWGTHLAAGAGDGRSADQVTTVKASNGNRIAVVPVVGTLMKSRSSYGGTSTVDLRRQIRAAAADPEVSGILLRVDSPGGTVAGTAELAREVTTARRSKPVVAHIEDTGASAAYWVASQASRVFASTPTAMVGSIGTLLTVSKAVDGGGLVVFRSGPHKGVGLDGITEEQAAHLQSLVDGLQAEFSAAIQAGRRLTAEQVTAVATGATWLAPAAQSLRLIDGIQTIEASIETLASMR